MDKNVANEWLKGKLIVSCQALETEPLHSSYIMGRMAIAAKEGGASGIRANSPKDIQEIKEKVDLPVIAIIKRVYEDSEVFITPTMTEIDELMRTSPEIIALDATLRKRPRGLDLETFYLEIRTKYPDVLLMADCSTLEDMITADKLGFDYIGTTLVGYTEESRGYKVEENDFEIIKEALKSIDSPLIAEGNIDTPEKVSRVLKLGAHCVVVGSAITRPQLITERFVNATLNI